MIIRFTLTTVRSFNFCFSVRVSAPAGNTCDLMSLTNAQPVEAARAAQSASRVLATLSATARNSALTALHEALSLAKDEIIAANARDLVTARKAAENGELSASILSRLDLAKKGKFEDMLRGIIDVRELEDPGRRNF